eukprot:gnl/TRDRNA2_/TRDRNA2_65649_c0_seq2.p1 gnl/TRDRNA2_/TRDRNA2_65649_c0~~gnl/TRDRNA2_/TRDRNA2_65649_c0_seq2.p1  ORF type:complete len:203 (+),score=23.59 gnl/TRDRNA2_/TRDRNA2_65649_c0_seq2:167-775(+)
MQRKDKSKSLQAKRKRKKWEEPLNWWAVGAVLIALLGSIAYLKWSVPPRTDLDLHHENVKRDGGILLHERHSSSSYLYNLMQPLLPKGWLDGMQTGAVTKSQVAQDGVIGFVPNTMTLSYKNTHLSNLRKELTKDRANGKEGAGVLGSDPSLATALAAIAERRDASSKNYHWLNSLPERFRFSPDFTAARLQCLAAQHAGQQ